MRREIVQGEGYAHVIYKTAAQIGDRVLHIYLESDGTPWIGGTRIATDPTPSQPVALRLMHLDPAPSVLVGRPCYHGMSRTAGCGSRMWTSKRYSESVVGSMAGAIMHCVRDLGAKGIVLIGYSGGGTLAMLLAERLEDVVAVVTIAANLDIDAWARLHHYTPLNGSLNPAERPPLRAAIGQLHIMGGRDENVPATLIENSLKLQPQPAIRMLAEADHVCCWEEAWPDLLREITQRFGDTAR